MEEAASTAYGVFHPSKKLYRFVILFFASMVTYGSYFAYDSIGALQPLLEENLGISATQNGMLYSFYSWPNLIFLIFAGFLIDRIGTKKASMLFSGMIVIGTVIVAAAPSFGYMLVGRVVFGLGSEALIVAQNAIIARWFKGKELALAFGITLTLCRLGTLFSFNTEALIAEYFGGFRIALWAAVIFCGLSMLSNFVYVIMDKAAEKKIQLREEGAGDKIVFKDVKKMPKAFWYVTMLCLLFYSGIFPFTAFSTDFFHEKWGLPLVASEVGGFLEGVFSQFLHMFDTAGGTTSIIIFASMCFAPFAGALVDKKGKRGTLMIFGSIIMIPTYLILGFTMLPPALPMIMLGAAFVLVPAALWPSIPLIVDENKVGTAYGVTTAIQNIGLALFPVLNGGLRDITNGYSASMVMFSSLGILGLVFAFLLKRNDAKTGFRLERAG